MEKKHTKSQNNLLLAILLTLFGMLSSRDPLRGCEGDQPNVWGSNSITAAESPGLSCFTCFCFHVLNFLDLMKMPGKEKQTFQMVV